jgi:hypothetical protein
VGDGGKGSSPRPFSVSQEEYDNRFEAIFGKKKVAQAEKVNVHYDDAINAYNDERLVSKFDKEQNASKS